MFDHESVSIPVGPGSIAAIPALELISIAQPEFARIKAQRHRNDNAVLPPAPALERLCADVQIVRRKRDVLSESKSKSNPDTLINRMTDVAADPQPADDVEINRAGDRRGQEHIRPLLVVAARLCVGFMDHEEAQKAQDLYKYFLRHQLRRLCGGSTVNEVSATTTLSPTCNRVVLASGLGRVAMITFVLWRSGVSVVR